LIVKIPTDQKAINFVVNFFSFSSNNVKHVAILFATQIWKLLFKNAMIIMQSGLDEKTMSRK
jgi:hypothetical protein